MRNTRIGYLSKRRNSPSAPFYYTHRFQGKVSNRSTILGFFSRKSIHAMRLICHYIKHSFGCCYFSCNTGPVYILLVWTFLTSKTGQAFNKECLQFNSLKPENTLTNNQLSWCIALQHVKLEYHFFLLEKVRYYAYYVHFFYHKPLNDMI